MDNMITGYGVCGQPAEKQLSIPNEMQKLREAVSVLQDNFNELHNRLSPVLRIEPEEAVTGEDNACPSNRCRIEQEIFYL